MLQVLMSGITLTLILNERKETFTDCCYNMRIGYNIPAKPICYKFTVF